MKPLHRLESIPYFLSGFQGLIHIDSIAYVQTVSHKIVELFKT
ncbi:MAG: hypothetical protein QXZ66_00065 [Thermoproteota archaeon]